MLEFGHVPAEGSILKLSFSAREDTQCHGGPLLHLLLSVQVIHWLLGGFWTLFGGLLFSQVVARCLLTLGLIQPSVGNGRNIYNNFGKLLSRYWEWERVSALQHTKHFPYTISSSIYKLPPQVDRTCRSLLQAL